MHLMKNLSVVAFFATLIAAVGCALLTSCTKQAPLLEPRSNLSFRTHVHVIDESRIKDKCADLGVAYEANGCTAYNLDTDTCDIYIMPQRYQQDDERLVIMGHELWHCMHGQWHN
jgi:hypothetical protein